VACRGKRLLIAKCDAGQLPPLYTCVCDSENKKIGRIVDLYGSVSKPYVTILSESDAILSLVGKELYIIPETKPEENMHRQKKRWKKYGNRN